MGQSAFGLFNDCWVWGHCCHSKREFVVQEAIFATFCESLLDAQGVLLIKLLNNRNNQSYP